MTYPRAFFLIIIFISFYVHPQQISLMAPGEYNTVQEVYFASHLKQQLLSKMAEDVQLKLEDINGSPYLDEWFHLGKIIDEKVYKENACYLRYNIYNDVIELKYSIDTSAPVYGFLKDPDFKAIIGDKSFYYRKFIASDGISKFGYLELMKDYGSFKLFKRHYQVLRLPKKARTSLEKDIPAKLSNYEHYYVEQNEAFKEVEMHRKKIVEAFPDHSSEAKKFIKKEKLRFKDEGDLIKLGDYLSSLK